MCYLSRLFTVHLHHHHPSPGSSSPPLWTAARDSVDLPAFSLVPKNLFSRIRLREFCQRCNSDYDIVLFKPLLCHLTALTIESKLVTMARGSAWSGPCLLLHPIMITLLLHYTGLIFLPWICRAHSCFGSFALAFPFVWKSLSQSIAELCSWVRSPTQRALPDYPCLMPFHPHPISFYNHLGCISQYQELLIMCFCASMRSHRKYPVHMGQLKRGE